MVFCLINTRPKQPFAEKESFSGGIETRTKNLKQECALRLLKTKVVDDPGVELEGLSKSQETEQEFVKFYRLANSEDVEVSRGGGKVSCELSNVN